MAELINNSYWDLSINNNENIILQTAGTYLDKDIKIQSPYLEDLMNITKNGSYDVSLIKNINVNVNPTIYTASVVPSSSGSIIQFSNLPGKPSMWQINCPLNGQLMWLGAYLVVNLSYDGNDYTGFSMYQPSSNDYVTIREPSYTATYNNGKLTINMTGEDLIMGDMTYNLMALC